MSQRGGGPKGGARGPAKQQAGVGAGDQFISLLPKAPPRVAGKQPIGRLVRLVTNLFAMRIQGNGKPIYQCGVDVDIIVVQKLEDQVADLKLTDKAAGETKKKVVEKKLSKQVRRDAVEAAIKDWVKKNNPKDFQKNLTFNYVLDSNGSVLYALFDMFRDTSKTVHEIEVALEFERFVNKPGDSKFDTIYFMVRIHKKRKGLDSYELNLPKLFAHCAGKVPLDPAALNESTRAMNVILRGQLNTISFNVMTTYGVFPYKQENITRIRPGVELCKGYTTSVRPAQCGVVLNLANSVAPFHEVVSLEKMLQTQFGVRDLNAPLHKDVIEKVKKEIKNKQVEATHRNYGTKERPHYRKYRVNDIGGSALDKLVTVDRETKKANEMTLERYYFLEYKVKLKYPKLPCVIDKERKIPFELCQLLDKQRITRKMTPLETAEIIKQAALRPEVYFQQVEKKVKELNNTSKSLKDFGLDFETDMIKVDGRELPPIGLVGASRQKTFPQNGEYRMRPNEKFVVPAKIGRWILTFIVDSSNARDVQNPNFADQTAKQFADLYQRNGAERGVQINGLGPIQFIPAMQGGGNRRPQTFDFIPESEAKKLLENFFVWLNQQKVEHALIVLPASCPEWVYGYIQYLEVSVGGGPNCTRTSCVKYDNFIRKVVRDNRGGGMFLSNLWLKHNSKLGGVNFVLCGDDSHDFLRDGYLFISIDVCHPAPGDKLPQSVAAVVGMWDLNNPRLTHCTRVRVQRKVRDDSSTIEDVGEVDVMVSEILDSYKAKKGKLPTKIIILRDGVSEGQYNIVLSTEIRKIKAVLNRKYQGKSPPISCLVVQKRHRIRFKREQPIQGRNGPDYNIQPGTVVDNTIMKPGEFAFYLAPHRALQGTSRAPNITVIIDENNLTQDSAQSMMHALSYLSPRCNKGTSIPTPVNLADLAAERGKNIVIGWNWKNNMKMSDDDRLKKLNDFLSKMGDQNYKNTLYYA